MVFQNVEPYHGVLCTEAERGITIRSIDVPSQELDLMHDTEQPNPIVIGDPTDAQMEQLARDFKRMPSRPLRGPGYTRATTSLAQRKAKRKAKKKARKG